MCSESTFQRQLVNGETAENAVLVEFSMFKEKFQAVQKWPE